MATIEERAEAFAEKDENIECWSDGWEEHSDYAKIKNAYIQGATEQRKLYIDKACDWIEEHFGESYLEYFLKALEE